MIPLGRCSGSGSPLHRNTFSRCTWAAPSCVELLKWASGYNCVCFRCQHSSQIRGYLMATGCHWTMDTGCFYQWASAATIMKVAFSPNTWFPLPTIRRLYLEGLFLMKLYAFDYDYCRARSLIWIQWMIYYSHSGTFFAAKTATDGGCEYIAGRNRDWIHATVMTMYLHY